DVLLASIASCFAIAMAYAARKTGADLTDLQVTATATYDGPRFATVAIALTSTVAPDTLERLIPLAQRVCYVTNTLRQPPEMTISVPGPRHNAFRRMTSRGVPPPRQGRRLADRCVQRGLARCRTAAESARSRRGRGPDPRGTRCRAHRPSRSRPP